MECGVAITGYLARMKGGYTPPRRLYIPGGRESADAIVFFPCVTNYLSRLISGWCVLVHNYPNRFSKLEFLFVSPCCCVAGLRFTGQ
ncbi:hypothetical protein BaRGS_00000618 [Batillaria attramentaria]|uniref:Uncharacterized protein n=1 Tax=Batillaria attramentaria TaxID=370345 RepID=A0ABD0M982_9CAEN